MLSDEVTHVRGPDRRRTHHFVVQERRSGFERRTRHRAAWVVAFDALLAHFRDHHASLITLLVLANVLSALDLALTLILLRLGVVEGNPVMQYLFQGSSVQAPIVKCGLIAAASLVIWTLRRNRAALETALFLAGLYGAVVIYEIVGLVWLG